MDGLGSCRHLRRGGEGGGGGGGKGGERYSIKLFLPLLWEYKNVTECLSRTILDLPSNSHWCW